MTENRMLGATRLVINKVTTQCNCHCRYCGADAANYSGYRMDLTTFRAAVDVVAGSTTPPHLTWLFQGGEPLTMGLAWYREALSYARGVCEAKGLSIDFGITTNGVLLAEDMAAFLAREGVIVGVSMDGPPDINDAFRTNGADTLRGIRLLRKSGTPFRVVCMITPANWNKMEDVISFFQNEGSYHVRVNLFYAAGRGRNCAMVTPRQALEAKATCLAWMLEHDDRFTEINVIHHVLRYFGRHALSLGAVCTTIHCGAGNGFLCIMPDGAIYPCGRAADVDADSLLGHVHAVPSCEKTANVLARFHAVGSLLVSCVRCTAAVICDFGCPAYARACHANWELDCSVTRHFFEYIRRIAQVDGERLLSRIQAAHRRLPKELGN